MDSRLKLILGILATIVAFYIIYKVKVKTGKRSLATLVR